jgi:hypothetical protein
MPSDEIGPECSGTAAQNSSPYFGGRKSGSGYKRKRGSSKAGGGTKLTKKGKWLSKTDGSKRGSYSGNKSSGSSYKKTSTAPQRSTYTASKGQNNLLEPPRPRTANK